MFLGLSPLLKLEGRKKKKIEGREKEFKNGSGGEVNENVVKEEKKTRICLKSSWFGGHFVDVEV